MLNNLLFYGLFIGFLNPNIIVFLVLQSLELSTFPCIWDYLTFLSISSKASRVCLHVFPVENISQNSELLNATTCTFNIH